MADWHLMDWLIVFITIAVIVGLIVASRGRQLGRAHAPRPGSVPLRSPPYLVKAYSPNTKSTAAPSAISAPAANKGVDHFWIDPVGVMLRARYLIRRSG